MRDVEIFFYKNYNYVSKIFLKLKLLVLKKNIKVYNYFLIKFRFLVKKNLKMLNFFNKRFCKISKFQNSINRIFVFSLLLKLKKLNFFNFPNTEICFDFFIKFGVKK